MLRSGYAAVLIDEDVLDSYLALAALRPARALLIHAAAFARHADRLARRCSRELDMSCELIEVGDDTDAAEIRQLSAARLDGVHLHHTGGTGSLAACLRAHHQDASSASYLDEDRRLLRFDDGDDYPLIDVIDPRSVDLDVLFALNGFDERRDDPRRDALRRELVDDAIGRLRAAPTRDARQTVEHIRADVRARLGSELNGWKRGWVEGGGFFEDIVAHAVRQAAPNHDVRVGVFVTRDGTSLELDVVAVGHYRPYVISCTIGSRPDTAKAKLFEVLLRARQVGGLTARPAVACTLDDGAAVPPSALESLARSSPQPTQAPRVFGATELAQWLSSGDLDRLSDFLAS